MAGKLVFAPEAQADLFELYDYIAGHGGPERALSYIGRIEAACRNLPAFPERGTPRPDVRPGLRVLGFANRVSIAFHSQGGDVVIDRILYGGRDLGLAFES